MYYLNKMLDWNKETGKLINKDIRRTIKKQIRIHSKYIYRFDRVQQYIDWVEDNFLLTNGSLEPLKLLPTQKWWVELMLGYDMIDAKGKQVQLTNEFFGEMGRGTGKSTFVSPRVLHWMIMSRAHGGEALVIAYDNEQARHVFEQVRNQTQASPLIKTYADSNLFRSTKQGLKFEPYGTTFKKQTNDTLRAQGGKSSLNVFDEVHTYGDDITESVNKGSRMKQDNWQSIYITSGGTKRDGLFDKMLERFTSEAEFNNDRSFDVLYRLENVEQVKNKKNWSMALPLIGNVPSMEAVEMEYELAKGDPALQIKFLAFSMGLSMQDTAYYFTAQDTELQDFDLSVFNGAHTYVGIDLSLVGDLTSIAFTCNVGGKTYTYNQSFSIRAQYEQLDQDQKDIWTEFIDDGSLILLDTQIIQASDLINYMVEFKKKTGARFKKIGYDPARYEYLEELIERYFFDKDGDNQTPIRQGFAMNDYINLMKSKMMNKTLMFKQPLLRWAFNNTAVKIGQSQDLMYIKKLQKDKIDPTVATTMSLQVLVQDDEL